MVIIPPLAMLMVFGFGAIVGPFLGAWFMTIVGHIGLFLFTGSIHLALTGYTMARILRRPPLLDLEKTPFVSVPRTTQAILALDPRSKGISRMVSDQQVKGQ